jgi:TonB family protein
MRLRILLPALLVGLSAGPAARADLTFWYKLTLKAGEGMPNEASAAVLHAMKAIPPETVTRIRGDMSRSEAMGRVTLMDYARRQVTVLDPREKRFATVPFDEFPAAVPPPADAVEAQRNIDVYAAETGRFARVYGISVQEHAIVMSLVIPGSSGQPLEVRVDMGLWLPLADETARVPELNEYAAWAARVRGSRDPMEMLNRLFAAVPGFSQQMRAATESLREAGDAPPLKVQIEVRMTGAPEIPAGNLAEVDLELVDMSNAPLAEDLFNVPPGYSSVSAKDLQGAALPAQASGAAMSPQPAAAASPPPTPAGDVLPIGVGVTAPKLLTKVEPQYAEAARQARVEGTVALAIVVGSDGMAHDLHILTSLRPDLDQKAIEAVSQWKFQPGEKDGKPVNVHAVVEVNFRLLRTPR